MDYKQLWDGVLAEIELSVSKANFNTWFKDTYVSEVDRGSVVYNPYVSKVNSFHYIPIEDF